MSNENVSAVDEKLPMGKNIIYALQHVFVMVAGAVAVPIIVGGASGSQEHITFLVSCALLAGGFATLLQTLGFMNYFGAKIPVIEATSFAAVGAMVGIASTAAKAGDGAQGLRIIAGCVIAAGLFCFIMANVWGKVLNFFPKVVTGTVVAIIGISLFPVGINWIVDNNKIDGVPVAPLNNILLALATLLLILVLSKFLKGILGNLSVLLGIVGGTIIAIISGMANFSSVSTAPLFSIVTPFKFGLPIFSAAPIISFILIMLVIMTEATGNMIAVHNMAGKKIDEANLVRGLRSSGLSTMLSGVFNSYPVTPFAQNVGMVSMTGVFSRYVTATAGVILLILGFFPKFAAVFASIPKPVLGGAGFAMFGMVAVGGIRTLGSVNYNGNKNALIVAVSIGLSLIPTAVPNFFKLVPAWAGDILHSGITIGCLSAILLNIFFNMFLVPKDQREEVKH